MRSCTGWRPGCGSTLPRHLRTDGSNFQLQHWTHTFDFARWSPGAVTVRETEMPARSAEFNHPMVAVAADGSRQCCRPPARCDGRAGRRGAVGRTPRSAATRPPPAAPGLVDPEDVTIRLVRNPRRDKRIRDLLSPVGKIAGLVPADLLETARGRRAVPAAAARLSDRHPAGAPRRAHGAGRRRVRPGPDAEGELNPCTPATGCTTAAPPAGRLCPPWPTCTRKP